MSTKTRTRSTAPPLPYPDGQRLVNLLREAEQTGRRLEAALRRHDCRTGRSGCCDDCALWPIVLEAIVGTLRLGNDVEGYLTPGRHRQFRQPR